MNLLYISTFMFSQNNGKTFALPSCADSFFSKYLDVFDEVRVLGENVKSYLDPSKLVEIKEPRISVRILPRNTSPKEFKNDKVLKEALKEEISKAEAILIKPSTRRGIMAIKIAEKLNKPYMIEMTGDIHNALKQNPSVIRRLYAPVIYRKIKRAIRNCPYGLYVSRDYLQGKYPIKGKMCGCSDVVLEKSDDAVLQKRFEKIDNMKNGDTVKLALIGFYQGNGKGVDTAIRALAQLPDNYELSVLGNGTEKSRNDWYAYAKERGVDENRLHFPPPLPSANEVLLWLDGYDFFVLPTRSEGLGRCIVEAMSRGCPSLATDICTMPELLPEECRFSLDDDKTLARYIAEYSRDKSKMKELAKKHFEKAKEYDFDILKQRRNEFLIDFKNYCER